MKQTNKFSRAHRNPKAAHAANPKKLKLIGECGQRDGRTDVYTSGVTTMTQSDCNLIGFTWRSQQPEEIEYFQDYALKACEQFLTGIKGLFEARQTGPAEDT